MRYAPLLVTLCLVASVLAAPVASAAATADAEITCPGIYDFLRTLCRAVVTFLCTLIDPCPRVAILP